MVLGREEQVSAVLDKVAKRRNVPVTSVALAYALQKVSCKSSPHCSVRQLIRYIQTPYLFPIVGGRKVAHLKTNVEALSLELTPEDVADIEKGYDFDLGFPHNFLNLAGYAPQGPQDVSFLGSMGHFDHVSPPTAIKPHGSEQKTAFKA